MKKTLSLMLIASLILAPTYRCMANYELEPENRSMGRLTKMAILGALATTASAGYKLYHWYQMKDKVEKFNKLYPKPQHDSEGAVTPPSSDAVIYAEWALDRYPTINSLWINKDNVISDLRAQQPSLSEIQKAMAEELQKFKITEELQPYTIYNKNKPGFKAEWSSEELEAYYKEIEDGSVAVNAIDQAPGKIEYTFAYAWNSARYAWNKARQFVAWAIKKPVIDADTRPRYVQVLKKKDRLKTLLAIVQEAQKPAKTAKKEAPATASDAAIAATLQQQQTPVPASRSGCAPAPAPAAVNAAQIEAARKEVADAQSGVNAVEDSTPANQKNIHSFRYQMGLAQTRLTEAQKALRKLEA